MYLKFVTIIIINFELFTINIIFVSLLKTHEQSNV